MVNNLAIVRAWPAYGPALSVAYSDVSPGYTGPCELVLSNNSGRVNPVFPDIEVALSAAGIAINLEVGGYNEVTVSAAKPGVAVTHETAMDWAL